MTVTPNARCLVCDTPSDMVLCPHCAIHQARNQALEEAARRAELDAGWDSVNCIQDDFNYSQEHKAISRRIAAAIRALILGGKP